MAFDIDLIGPHPDRIRKAERHRFQLPREHRRQMQTACNVATDTREKVAARRFVEQMGCADMHRRIGRFQMQKQRIQAGQWLQASPSVVLVIPANAAGSGAVASSVGW
jgi:hypothetical protein